MIELMLGALVVTGMLYTGAQAVGDFITTLRASKDGQWDMLEAQRLRRHERYAKAWDAVRKARHKAAGGDGEYRPGFGAYLDDVYHGFWEDQLAKRKAKRDARPPYDPTKSTRRERADKAVEGKVARLRAAAGRAARVLIEPVGEGRDRLEPVTSDPGSSRSDELEPCKRDDCKGQIVEVAHTGRFVCGHLVNSSDPIDVRCNACGWLSSHTPPRSCGNCTHTPSVPITPEKAPTSNEGVTMDAAEAVVVEVNNNEDARRAFAAMAAAAREAAEAIEALEIAKARLAAAANGTADGMSGKRFDSLATNAASEAADIINVGTLAEWSERIDAVLGAAERGLQSLDKYLDAEEIVAANNIDASTLEPSR